MGIEDHFEARKKDDEEFAAFEEHVNQRKNKRAEQIQLRQEREKEKRAREEEKKKKEEEEERLREEKEESKKLAFIPDRAALKKAKSGDDKVSWNQKIKDLYAKMAVA